MLSPNRPAARIKVFIRRGQLLALTGIALHPGLLPARFTRKASLSRGLVSIRSTGHFRAGLALCGDRRKPFDGNDPERGFRVAPGFPARALRENLHWVSFSCCRS